MPWKVAENINKLWCAKSTYASRFSLPSEVPEAVQQKLDEIRKKGVSSQLVRQPFIGLEPAFSFATGRPSGGPGSPLSPGGLAAPLLVKKEEKPKILLSLEV